MTFIARHIFLVDAFGALASAVAVGWVLPLFQSRIGLPIPVLHLLASVALVYAAFSFFCYWFVERKRLFLSALIVANLFYSVLTGTVVANYAREVKSLGLFYFLAEILIILALVAMEWKVSQRLLDCRSARGGEAPAKSSGSVSIVFRVSDYDAYLANAAKNGVVPTSFDPPDPSGRFAHFVDPDGNEMTIWGK